MMLGALLAPAQDLGRLATDLIWFSSDELGYLRLSSQVTTGSSIMPQKRNPDVLELVRASAALLRARHAEIGAIYGPLFSGYQRDLQLTKAPFIEGFQCTIAMFTVLQPVLETIEVDVDRCRNAILRTTGATDAVYHRVAQGEPFRQAYRMVAADPEHSVDQEPSDQWKHRTHLGAPGNLDLIRSRQRLQEINQWLIKNQTLVSRVWDILK
jgi:argininosuccinate lyase